MTDLGGEKGVGAMPADTTIGTEERGLAERPTGWMYKERRIGPLKIPCYASPPFQLALVAFTCFMCPGMFNALNGLGAAGQFNASTADNSNTALYSTFSVFGFFAGTFANRMGLRLTLSLGGFGYCLYIASYLCYNHTQNEGFVLFAGALLGVCAAFLWTAQGAIMMSYPPENSKVHGNTSSYCLIRLKETGSLHILVLDHIQSGSRPWELVELTAFSAIFTG